MEIPMGILDVLLTRGGILYFGPSDDGEKMEVVGHRSNVPRAPSMCP